MVKLGLFMRADLDGVDGVVPLDGEQHYYKFTISCSSCRETHKNAVMVSAAEQRPMSGSRGEANLVWKCANCTRENTVNLLAGEKIAEPRPYGQAESGSMARMVGFDCRGCELEKFIPEGTFVCCGSETSTKFDDVDLSSGEWYDYDEKAGAEVSITAVEWEIRRI